MMCFAFGFIKLGLKLYTVKFCETINENFCAWERHVFICIPYAYYNNPILDGRYTAPNENFKKKNQTANKKPGNENQTGNETNWEIDKVGKSINIK